MTLDEKVFRKMGWSFVDYEPGVEAFWESPSGETSYTLPEISSSWEVCAKYLVPFMRGKEYEYEIQDFGIQLGKVLIWRYFGTTASARSEIKDDNIAEAACKAFMEVEL